MSTFLEIYWTQQYFTGFTQRVTLHISVNSFDHNDPIVHTNNWKRLLTGFQVIAAEGEMTASRSLKEAADVMSETPAAMQLRYLQTLNTISAEKNSTIIFPLPVDFMSNFFQK